MQFLKLLVQCHKSITLFQFDQTHNANLVTQIELPKNWQISSRFRYVTGTPYTPIEGGIFAADNDVYMPVRGPFFSKRLEDFFQLDIRVDKKWAFDTWILSFYLDVQNVLNRRNIESIQYSYDYTQTANVAGLPILPTLGVKGEF